MPTVSAADIGSPNEPGEYHVSGIHYQVDQQHLNIWRETPETALNTILCTRVNDDRVRLILGSEFRA